LISGTGHFWWAFRGHLFSGTGDWTQGLELARWALYHLSHAPNLFYFSYFLDRTLHFFPGASLDPVPPPSL
jgi:hypothetical protein